MSFLRPSQRMAMEQDLEAVTGQMSDPLASRYIQDKAGMRKHAKNIKDTLEKHAPNPYENKNEISKAMSRLKDLKEQITTNMPSQEEMRRNRAGSVHKHMRWEKENKKKILEAKEIMARLDPKSEDPDLCNIEKWRKESPFVYDTTAQIAGHHAMSEQAKANWPLGEPKAQTAVAHVAVMDEDEDAPKSGTFVESAKSTMKDLSAFLGKSQEE